MKKIEDYLQLYLGCDCMADDHWKSFVIGIHTNGNVQLAHTREGQDKWESYRVKLILRSLADMTDDEFKIISELEDFAGEPFEFENEILSHKIHGWKYIEKGEPDDLTGDPLAQNCIAINRSFFHGVKGENPVYSEPSFDYYWTWEYTCSTETFRFLLSCRFDIFDLITAGLAIETVKAKGQ